MPTYDYQCEDCSHQFEIFQAMTEKPLKKCPECGAKVKRLIGPGAGLIFKGSGFYITDYKKKEKQSTAGRERTSGSNKTSEKKTEKSKKEGGESPKASSSKNE